jgi:type IV secretory pathway VirB2 component (pilin)
MFKKLSFFSFIFLAIFLISFKSSSAVARFAECRPGTPCDAGLVCDTGVKSSTSTDPNSGVCVGRSETACSGVVSCTVGGNCYADNAVQPITPGTSTIGVCRQNQNIGVNNNPFVEVMCKILGVMTGKGARIASAIMLVIIGFTTLMGKTSVQVFIIFIVGCGLVYGSSAIVGVISGGDSTCSSPQ